VEFATASAQTNVKITVAPEFAGHGITLVPATDPDAAAQLQQRAGVDLAMIQSIRRYAVVLLNNSDKRLLQTTVGYKWRDAEGNPKMFLYSLMDYNVDPPTQIKPGEGRLFVPQQGLNLHFGMVPRRATPAGYQDIVAAIERDLSQVTNIEVFLDSVTVEGFGVVGPDRFGVREKDNNRSTTY